jgi:hypothetical protein
MVALGIANTRMKDFYDLYRLSETQEFDGEILAASIRATFERRGTAIPTGLPLALSDAFGGDADKQAQWRAFLRQGHLDNVPASLAVVTERLATFLLPAARATASGEAFQQRWGRGRREGGWVPS